MKTTTALIIPTLNSMRYLDLLLPALERQTLRPDEILIIDSSSRDGSAERWREWGARVEVINPQSFNHGGTRRIASRLTTAEVMIYMTQDAVPASERTLELLVQALFHEPDIGKAFGRQLPHPNSSVLAQQSRAYNYPPTSRTKRLADKAELGIKTCFSSNSFAAYRRDALEAVGGFPEDVIGTEDAYVAGRMLLGGYAVRYAAEACVYHSHDYSLKEEFKRYFDIGVFYGRESWIRSHFGGAGGDGRRYVQAEIRAVIKARKWWLLPEVGLRTVCKLAGYRLGKLEKRLPKPLKRHVSMFPPYWK